MGCGLDKVQQRAPENGETLNKHPRACIQRLYEDILHLGRLADAFIQSDLQSVHLS